ncbi:MAG: hypothetical protein H6719_12290 [Sandaracinaceae bacterium]|nr:hypothetical protein [Sandaracinaceae bacterium]
MGARFAFALAIGVSLLALSASEAHACGSDPLDYEPSTGRPIYGWDATGAPIYDPPEPPTPGLLYWEALYAGQAALNLAFVGTDIGYGVANEIPPEVYAVLEITVAVVNTLATVGWAVGTLFSASAGGCDGAGLRSAAIPIAAGVSHLFAVTFFVHGSWALNRGHDRPTVTPTVSIGPGGFSIGVAGLLD